MALEFFTQRYLNWNQFYKNKMIKCCRCQKQLIRGKTNHNQLWVTGHLNYKHQKHKGDCYWCYKCWNVFELRGEESNLIEIIEQVLKNEGQKIGILP